MDNEVWKEIKSIFGDEITNIAWDIAFDEGRADGESTYYENMQE